MSGYIYEFEGKGQFDPSGRVVPPVSDREAHNKRLEQAELAAWAEAPERFALYVSGDGERATTWLGTPLGVVFARAAHKRFRRSGEPYTITHIIVSGTNGHRYHGTYGSDWSDLCRVRRCKKS